MNKKLVISIVLFSLCCLTIVSALNFKEAFNNVVSEPLNNLITGRYFDSFGKPGTIYAPPSPTPSGDIIIGVAKVSNVLLDAQGCGAAGTYANMACRAKRWCVTQGYETGIQSEFNNIDNTGEIYCLKGDGVDNFAVNLVDLEAQGCSGGMFGYSHQACRAKRWCVTQGYETGIQSEFNPDNSGEIYCFKGENIIEYKSIPNSILQQTTCGALGTSDHLMCRAKRYCTDKDHITGIQSEFGPDYGDIYCIKSTTETITPPAATCTDTDNGKKIFLKGITTSSGNVEEDQCVSLNYKSYTLPGASEVGGFFEVDSCKIGNPVPGGYIHTCYIDERFCDSGLIKEERIACNFGACYNGKCACEHDTDCGIGYECTDWNENLRKHFCKSTEPVKCMGCVSDNICYPLGSRKGNEYCSIIQNDYAWDTQKVEGDTCVNSWECQTGLCVEAKCTKLTAAGTTVTTDCVGCTVQNKCLPIGTRKAGEYCGVDDMGNYGMFSQIAQDATDISCENDYECETNVCVQGECSEPKQDTGLLMMIWCKVTLGLGSGCD